MEPKIEFRVEKVKINFRAKKISKAKIGFSDHFLL